MIPLLTEQQLDERIGDLPPLSPVVGELMDLLEAPTVDYGAVEQSIGHEPVLASRVLRLANSSFFGFAGRIGSLREACLVLGSRTLRQTILAAAVMQQLEVDGSLLDAQKLWRHALATGAIAKYIARVFDIDQELAFTAGLLHDLGKLALAAYFTEEYRQVLLQHADSGGLMLETERRQLGFDHAMVGELLARKWHFPAALAQAVGRHHLPDPADSTELADLIHLADVLAHALGYGGHNLDRVPPLAPQAWERLGMDWEQLGELLPALDDEANEAIHFEL